MAHRIGDTAYPAHDIPAFALNDPRCPAEIKTAYLAIDEANDTTATLRAEQYAIAPEADEAKAAYLQAARDGKRLPALTPPEIVAERESAKDMEARRAAVRAMDAATRFEKLLLVHAPALRAIYAEKLPVQRDEAVRKQADARTATAQVRATADAIRSLDHTAAVNVSRPAYENVTAFYGDVRRHDTLTNHHGRADRLAASWADVEAAAAGMPVEMIVKGHTSPTGVRYLPEATGAMTDEQRRSYRLARAQQQAGR